VRTLDDARSSSPAFRAADRRSPPPPPPPPRPRRPRTSSSPRFRQRSPRDPPFSFLAAVAWPRARLGCPTPERTERTRPEKAAIAADFYYTDSYQRKSVSNINSLTSKFERAKYFLESLNMTLFFETILPRIELFSFMESSPDIGRNKW
jgi:hypothetical protein